MVFMSKFTKKLTVLGITLLIALIMSFVAFGADGGKQNVCEHTYKTVTIKATPDSNGKVATKCKYCGYIAKTVRTYKPSDFVLSSSFFTYNGKVQTPSVKIYDNKGNPLKYKADFTLKYPSGRKAVGQYAVTVTFKGKYSGTKKLYFDILPRKVTGFKITPSVSSLKMEWNKVTGATGYQLYFYYEGNLIMTVNTKNTCYTMYNLREAAPHTVKIKAYKVLEDETKLFSKTAAKLLTSTVPDAPALTVKTEHGKVNLNWKKVYGATGYEIFMSETKKDNYVKIGTVGSDSLKFTKTGFSGDKTYYFKVRGIIDGSSGKYYGECSSVKVVKIK